jgi:mRNA-degrading endonuclease YafQ of YafQ-DinJ toxin-antitoxin module
MRSSTVYDIAAILSKVKYICGTLFDVLDILLYHIFYFDTKCCLVTNLDISVIKKAISSHYQIGLIESLDIKQLSYLKSLQAKYVITDSLKAVPDLFNHLYFLPTQSTNFPRYEAHKLKKIWFKGLKTIKICDDALLIYSLSNPVVYPMKEFIQNFRKVFVYGSSMLSIKWTKIYNKTFSPMKFDVNFFSKFDSFLILDAFSTYKRLTYTPRLPLECRYQRKNVYYLGNDSVLFERCYNDLEFFSFPDLSGSAKWFIYLPQII